MKKVLYTLAGMAMIALGAVSCQKETSFEAGKDGSVTFTVNLPGVETKAISDGTTAKKLDFAIYDGDGKYLEELTASAQKSDFDGKKATVTVQVIKDLTYQFVFFAKAAENSPYTFDAASKKLSIDYGAANLEAADAFYYATEPIKVEGAFSRDITLTRPLAQINFGSSNSDIAAAKLVSDWLRNFMREIGMVPLKLHKEQPGYILNSMLVPFLSAAQALWATGVADVPTIDRTWELATGAPAGPFKILDIVGLETAYNINQMKPDAQGEGTVTNLLGKLLKEKIDKGETGVNAGKGFYDYTKK